MLTAKSEEVDKVVGLELGADDYITKPFGVRELLARVSAALRRSRVTSQEADSKSEVPAVFQIGGGRVDCRRHSVFLEKRELALTARELALLKVFYQYPNEVLTRDFLLNQVWGVKYFGTTRTLDQQIAQLRKKIEPAKSPTVIRTVHGVGYRYDHYG
jgi:DNA-binding response OmpR family regulator